MQRRFQFLVLFALLCLAAFATQRLRASGSTPRPNFVFILIDDLGWRDLGCFGGTFYETPNIDRLAAQGMRFTNAYAACPVCSPTRASILTGKYPARLHLTDFLSGRADRPSQKLLRARALQYLPLEETTIAKALKPLGYVSASIGKWHLGKEPYYPEKHGFDINIGGTDTGSPPGGYFRFRTPTMVARNEREYLTDRLTEEAEKFIDQSKERPFFLYLAHYAVHIPLQAKPALVAKYEAKAKRLPGWHNPVYAAMVESVDESVGRVMKKLDDLHLAEHTVVIFMSDNGGLSVREGPDTPATSNLPLRDGKGYLYEGGIREPMIMRWPDTVKPSSVCDVPVSSIDFYPTMLEGASGQAPSDTAVDGVSLLPVLKQTGPLKRDALYWHYPHYSNQGGKPSGAIRQGDFKLIESYEDGRLELFDLKNDLGEQMDLSTKKPDKTKELHALLDAWRKSINAQMPTPNPNYRPARR